MMKAITKHIQNEKITKDGLATLFKRPANAKANHRSMVPQDAKLALKMQQQLTEKKNGSTDSTDDDVQATKENVKSLFAGKRSQATDSTDTETTEQQQDAETQKAYQMQVLKQTQSQSTEDLGESRLGHATGNKRADVEHLFAASRRNMNQDKFGYMSNGQRKQLQNDFVQSKVEEAAKLFYNNANVTINLVPALVGGGLLLLLLIPLLALLFQPAAESSGYGAPAAEYGAPAPAYGAPEYRSDEGYEDFRALFTNLLDSDSASPQFELTKRMQAVAGPVMSRLSDAASKLIQ